MAASSTPTGRAVEALKRCGPTSVRVFLADDRTETLAVPTNRKKWSRVAATLEKLRWWKLEALNAQGEILEVQENDEPAEDLEDIGELATGGEVARMVQLMLHGQDVALRRHESIVEKMLKVNVQLSEVLMQRLTAVEKAYQANLTALGKLTARAEEEEPGEMSGKVLAAIPDIIKLKQVLAATKEGGGNSEPK